MFTEIAWLFLGLLGGGLEVWALKNKRRGDSLSELIWKLRWPWRVAIATGLTWLGYHFVTMRWWL